MQPNDLFDINTQSFSPVKLGSGNIKNRPEIANTGKIHLNIKEDRHDNYEDSIPDNRSELSNELQIAK